MRLVIALLGATVLLAWWLSERRRQRTRALVLYLRDHEPEFWRTLPWVARHLNINGAVERYRRTGKPIEPELAVLYAARRRAFRSETAAILSAVVLIGLLALGLTSWGWQF
jgi:hypothetical protein